MFLTEFYDKIHKRGKDSGREEVTREALKRLIVVILFGFCLTAVAHAVEVSLKYVKFPEKPESYLPVGYVRLNIMTEPPAGEWKMPELKSKYSIYALVRLGDRNQLCILDCQNTSDAGYNRLYFDANGNHDLTDDPVFDGTLKLSRSKRNNRTIFPAVDTTIEVDGKQQPYSFLPRLYSYSIEQLKKKGFTEENVNRYVRFSLIVNCYYSGKFQVNGKSYGVILGDRNCNGRFDDTFTVRRLDRSPRRFPIRVEGDLFCITGGEKIGSYAEQVSGDRLLVKDRLFDVSINTPENKLTLTPIDKNLAPISLAMKMDRVSLFTEDQKHFLNMYQPDKEIRIPRGKYRPLEYEVLRKEKKGDIWRLCAAATVESPSVTVDEGRKSILEFGEPYTPFVDIRKGLSTLVYLTFRIEGKGKELLTDLSHISGNKTRIRLSKKKRFGHRPKEPTYTIRNASGKVVERGSFEYG